jgi:hypothetical protein
LFGVLLFPGDKALIRRDQIEYAIRKTGKRPCSALVDGILQIYVQIILIGLINLVVSFASAVIQLVEMPFDVSLLATVSYLFSQGMMNTRRQFGVGPFGFVVAV